jgi:S-adenosylmethionine:tRNA ribosyltransferase-isomerase
MKLSDFDFHLPEELIAQMPTTLRDESRLLISANDKKYEDKQFKDIISYLRPGDVLVLNNSKVVNTKLTLNKDGNKIGLNLSHQIEGNIWSAFAKGAKRLSILDAFVFDQYTLVIKNKLSMGQVEVEIKGGNVFDFLDLYGTVPIPHYIRKGVTLDIDNERYQTIYAHSKGSSAAPTAGLHFTDDILNALKAKGVEIGFVTLHVGAGTFLPVKTENIYDHNMHYEDYHLPLTTAVQIMNAKREGRRVIAVGTTATRVLESVPLRELVSDAYGKTNLFITPGFQFQVVDALITNFHLPKSTLLMLVSAFAGYERIMDLYRYAISRSYRFFSYGDAMFLEKYCASS